MTHKDFFQAGFDFLKLVSFAIIAAMFTVIILDIQNNGSSHGVALQNITILGFFFLITFFVYVYAMFMLKETDDNGNIVKPETISASSSECIPLKDNEKKKSARAEVIWNGHIDAILLIFTTYTIMNDFADKPAHTAYALYLSGLFLLIIFIFLYFWIKNIVLKGRLKWLDDITRIKQD